MDKQELLKEAQQVIKTSGFEREHIKSKRNSISKYELEISKTIISANKNIVSALIVAKSLLNNGQEN